MSKSRREIQILYEMLGAAVEAAKPIHCLKSHIPKLTHSGRTVILGAGKAAASMALALENHWPKDKAIEGLVVTRYGHRCPTQFIEVLEASHPVPDINSARAAERIMEIANSLTKDDLCICLMSGGGSAVLALPGQGLKLADKININQSLLKSGADITEMNCVRKHLSAIKGGRLAAAAYPAKVLTIAISDVIGDDPATIASGPTVADPSTAIEARKILEKYNIVDTPDVLKFLQSNACETLKPGAPELRKTEYVLAATPQLSLTSAAQIASSYGYRIINLGDHISGDAAAVGRNHADIALSAQEQGEKVCILSGGETTVEVTGSGRGGRNTTYLLSLTKALAGAENIHAIACDTDGIDGSEDNAGAWTAPETWGAMHEKHMDPHDFLCRNDAYSFFSALNQLVITGPTLTNVNDFRAILVTPTSNM